MARAPQGSGIEKGRVGEIVVDGIKHGDNGRDTLIEIKHGDEAGYVGGKAALAAGERIGSRARFVQRVRPVELSDDSVVGVASAPRNIPEPMRELANALVAEATVRHHLIQRLQESVKLGNHQLRSAGLPPIVV
jgi:hypothetical protein